jgi:hypothetical protein
MYDVSYIDWDDVRINPEAVFAEVAAAANMLDLVLDGVPQNPNYNVLKPTVRDACDKARANAVEFTKVAQDEEVYSIFNFVDVNKVETTQSAGRFASIIGGNLKAFSKLVTDRLEHTFVIGQVDRSYNPLNKNFLTSIATKKGSDTKQANNLGEAVLLIREGKARMTVDTDGNEAAGIKPKKRRNL